MGGKQRIDSLISRIQETFYAGGVGRPVTKLLKLGIRRENRLAI